MEDGTPFCKQCGAPQIRVPGIEAVESSAPGPGGVTPTGSAPEGPSLPSVLLSERRSPGVQWAHALPGAALGGAASLILMVPFALVAPAVAGFAFFLGGAFAVLLYRRYVKSPLTVRIGAKIGAATGAFALMFVGIVMIAGLVYRPTELQQAITQQWSAHVADPQKLQQLLDQIRTPEGLISVVVSLLIYTFIMMLVGFSIGGALCAAWLRKRAQK